MSAELTLLILVAAVVVALGLRALLERAVVQEYERGLLYRDGRDVRTLDPGGYWLVRTRSRVERVDMRRRLLAVAGQEVLSADNVGLKLSMAAAYEVAAPDRAVHAVEDYTAALYTAIQLAVRDAVAGTEVEEMLAQREALATAVPTRSPRRRRRSACTCSRSRSAT